MEKSLCLQQQQTMMTAVKTTNTITPTIIPIITLMETMKASIPSANKSPEIQKMNNECYERSLERGGLQVYGIIF